MESSFVPSSRIFFFVALSLLSFTAKPAAGLRSSAASSSAAPTMLPDFAPAQPPYQEISPDIAPLLPTPKGEASSPSDPSMPIIPSSLSPPNPDSIDGSGLDPVVSPSDSFSSSTSSTSSFVVDALSPAAAFGRCAGLVILVIYWLSWL